MKHASPTRTTTMRLVAVVCVLVLLAHGDALRLRHMGPRPGAGRAPPRPAQPPAQQPRPQPGAAPTQAPGQNGQGQAGQGQAGQGQAGAAPMSQADRMKICQPPKAKGKWLDQNCYNSNCVMDFESESVFCRYLVQNLAEPYPTEKEFRLGCQQMLGHWCFMECVHIAELFDQPTYWSGMAKSLAPTDAPQQFGNAQAQYTLKLDDCISCVKEYQCYARVPKSDT